MQTRTFKAITVTLILFLLYTGLAAQDFRVKKITITEFHPDRKEKQEVFTCLIDYTNGMVSAINGSNLEIKKDKIEYKGSSIGYYSAGFRKIELNKEGQVEKRGTHKLKFHKNGKIKEIEGTNIFSTNKINVFYDELDRTRLVGDNPTTDKIILLSYNDQNQAIKAEYGNYNNSNSKPTTAEWENGKLKAIYDYDNGNGLMGVTRHEFYYDSHGNISEEKIYIKNKYIKDGEEHLARHYQIEYEPGKGNDDAVFLDLNNPFTEILFGQKSFAFPYYVRY